MDTDIHCPYRGTLFVIHYIGHGVSETEQKFGICENYAEYLFATGNEISDQNGPTYDVNNNFTTRLTELLHAEPPVFRTVVRLHEALCTQANDPSTKLRYTPQYMGCRKPTTILHCLSNHGIIENPTPQRHF
ncbi:unnamed protein product [Penicillium roqueforti FM164]|uniref:Genomic scaffold, ProqFM164S03 n=1 Tax=Penicillium roqueforti (strain FM164) TaxID=1365484 RepID=W6QIZ0_PENRF|nr:unnamed protein product [Penicillium roqueforti FM164]